MIRPVFVASAALAIVLSGCMTAKSPQPPSAAPAASPLAAAPSVKPPTCSNISFPIYFRSGSAQLTDPAAQAIRSAAVQSKGCAVQEVLILGLADAEGSAAVGQAVSEERARTVAQALEAEGFPAPSIDAAAVGKTGAVNARGQTAPQRRRAEVSINFKH